MPVYFIYFLIFSCLAWIYELWKIVLWQILTCLHLSFGTLIFLISMYSWSSEINIVEKGLEKSKAFTTSVFCYLVLFGIWGLFSCLKSFVKMKLKDKGKQNVYTCIRWLCLLFRAKFESMCNHLYPQCCQLIDELLFASGLSETQIDKVSLQDFTFILSKDLSTR